MPKVNYAVIYSVTSFNELLTGLLTTYFALQCKTLILRH